MQNGSSTIVKGDDVQLCDVLASLILKGETVEEWQNSEVRRQLESNTPVARRRARWYNRIDQKRGAV